MKTMRAVYYMARADVLERVRRYGFLITVGLTVAGGYAFVPAADANYTTIDLAGYRGVYDSAWIGGMVALLTGLFVTLIGFYMVKNALERDITTGVGQIIGATPLNRPLYTLGKALSNLLVLAAMAGILAVVALAMQLMRGEVLEIHLWKLVSPFLLVTLPALAVTAALAVLFETIHWLRGSLGNVIYFFLWTALLVITISSTEGGQAGAQPVQANDYFGVGLLLPSMVSSCETVYPTCRPYTIGLNPLEGAEPLQTFVWQGVSWAPGIVLGRLLWMGLALVIALAAAIFFNRFDPSRERLRMRAGRITGAVPEDLVPSLPASQSEALRLRSASQLTPVLPGFRFTSVLMAELRLLIKGLAWWWYAVALGLTVTALLVPPDVATGYLLPAAWIWPILLWSPLGCREAAHRTEQIVFSAACPLIRQLPASWLTGVIVAAASGVGIAAYLLIAGEPVSLLTWGAGVLFVPSLALALGVWSRSNKLFEVLYATWWYIGPVNKVAALDFTGLSGSSFALFYLVIATGLLVMAFVGRARWEA